MEYFTETEFILVVLFIQVFNVSRIVLKDTVSKVYTIILIIYGNISKISLLILNEFK